MQKVLGCFQEWLAYSEKPMENLAGEEVSEQLKFENSKYKGRSAGPGGVTFIYGDGPRESVTHHSSFPETGDMYIFPAWLKHWVFPFKSECTRISVSGNVRDYIKIKDIKGGK